MLTCTLCGEDYYPAWRSLQIDANALCTGCLALNFAGTSPPLDPWGTARAALETYVDAQGPYQLTPRQAEAMRRLRARWAAEEAVDMWGTYQFTPRQEEAMARLAEARRRQEETP